MGIVYFDICAIPLILMILFICFTRKMFKGLANRMYIVSVFLALFTTIADLTMESTDNMIPMTQGVRAACTVATYAYFILRNLTPVFIILFLFTLTRTTFIIKKAWAKTVFFAPFGIIMALLAQNPFTGLAFVITPENGYTRGPLMVVFYAIAFIYGISGFAYCIYCRRYLSKYKWGSLLSIYALGYFSVFIQLFFPDLLIEMFCTAVSEMLILFAIIRPEEQMDLQSGMLSFNTYQVDLKNVIHSRVPAVICIIQIPNCREIRNYLGDHEYNKCLSTIANGIRSTKWNHKHNVELYFEMPGTIYLVTSLEGICTSEIGEIILNSVKTSVRKYVEVGVKIEPEICIARCPDDCNVAEDFIRLGHKFQKISRGKPVSFASDVISNKNYAVEAHIESIVDNAINYDGLEMYYQPIYDMKTGKYHSAEALARIKDPSFGMVSPSIFIPAAEALGRVIPIGDKILDLVFRFISDTDFESLGLQYIEINLSVAQCMEPSLPDKILAVQKKYDVDPAKVNLEITETTFSDISDIMLENINKLISMGYSFALDDYGSGYSSIQRVNKIPFKLIKIDKSLLDDILSPSGRHIYESTLHMMQNIGKQVVSEGAETKLEVELLSNMKGDYIQGFYFSRPLNEKDFVEFIRSKNSVK
ncbi:MAG: EAL domain-containing protein [Clostridia bacterium]|nr:EAL domain-containing protein [Clostridia bacterium]